MTTSCELENDVKYWRLVILMAMTMAATMGAKAAESSADKRFEAQIQSGEIGVTLQEVLCRAPDAALLARPDRLAGGDQGVPVLHLDDGQDAAAAGDQVDLADRAAETLGQHTVALEAQPPGGDAFPPPAPRVGAPARSEEHTSELQSLMRTSYAVFCLKKKKQ